MENALFILGMVFLIVILMILEPAKDDNQTPNNKEDKHKGD
jgi:hypothetical protein